MEHDELLSVIEAILFAAGDPVPASRIALVTGEQTQTIISAAKDLAAAYEENRCGMRLVQMNALLQRILPQRPLRDCGFTAADFKIFPQSVETNQQRLMTNAYYPFELESEEAIYRKCY